MFSEFLTRYSCWCPHFHTVWHRKDRSQSCGRHSLLRVMKCSSEHKVTCECHIEVGGGGRAVAKKLPGLPARSGSLLGRSILSFAKTYFNSVQISLHSAGQANAAKPKRLAATAARVAKATLLPKKKIRTTRLGNILLCTLRRMRVQHCIHRTQTCCRRRKKLARHPVCSSARGKRSSNTRCGEFIGLIPPRKEAQKI